MTLLTRAHLISATVLQWVFWYGPRMWFTGPTSWWFRNPLDPTPFWRRALAPMGRAFDTFLIKLVKAVALRAWAGATGRKHVPRARGFRGAAKQYRRGGCGDEDCALAAAGFASIDSRVGAHQQPAKAASSFAAGGGAKSGARRVALSIDEARPPSGFGGAKSGARQLSGGGAKSGARRAASGEFAGVGAAKSGARALSPQPTTSGGGGVGGAGGVTTTSFKSGAKRIPAAVSGRAASSASTPDAGAAAGVSTAKSGARLTPSSRTVSDGAPSPAAAAAAKGKAGRASAPPSPLPAAAGASLGAALATAAEEGDGSVRRRTVVVKKKVVKKTTKVVRKKKTASGSAAAACASDAEGSVATATPAASGAAVSGAPSSYYSAAAAAATPDGAVGSQAAALASAFRKGAAGKAKGKGVSVDAADTDGERTPGTKQMQRHQTGPKRLPRSGSSGADGGSSDDAAVGGAETAERGPRPPLSPDDVKITMTRNDDDDDLNSRPLTAKRAVLSAGLARRRTGARDAAAPSGAALPSAAIASPTKSKRHVALVAEAASGFASSAAAGGLDAATDERLRATLKAGLAFARRRSVLTGLALFFILCAWALLSFFVFVYGRLLYDQEGGQEGSFLKNWGIGAR